MKPSPKMTLNKDDVNSIFINVGIVAISAIITYLLNLLPNIDFGDHSEIVITVLTAVLKTAQKYFSGK